MTDQHQSVGTGGLNISHVSSDATDTNPSVAEGTTGDKDSGGLKPPADMEPTPPMELRIFRKLTLRTRQKIPVYWNRGVRERP